MTQYNFTTNIEKRMPTTGEVFFVDRMTSDYAQAHPFDVDAFIESVFQKWQACETIGFRETREALRRQWDATLGCRNPRGNAALYPNKNGEKHPALIEVWLKAGDYWRRGLRLGDVLPAVEPGCKITCTGSGWIALFPKDMHLLTAEPAPQPAAKQQQATAAEQQQATTSEQQEATTAEQQEATVFGASASEAPQSNPRDEEAPQSDPRDEEALQPDHRDEEEQQRKHSSLFTINYSLLKPLAVAAASVAVCVVIYETGLLIPLGLIGLGMGGLIK